MIALKERQVQSILIVDNSTSNLDLMRQTLESQTYQIELADGSKSALNQAIKASPDLILLNLMMLTSDNSDITSYLYDATRLSNIPILLFNGNISLDHEQMKNLGTNTINYKSFGLDILLLNINSLLKAKNDQEKSNHQQQIENIPLLQEKIILLDLNKDDPLLQEQQELEAIQNNHCEAIFWQELSTRGYEIVDGSVHNLLEENNLE